MLVSEITLLKNSSIRKAHSGAGLERISSKARRAQHRRQVQLEKIH